jgi:RND superfamily putative drug exporter
VVSRSHRHRRDAHRLRRTAAAFGRGYRTAVSRGRWFVIAAWIAAVVALPLTLGGGATGGGGLGGLLPAHSRAVQLETRSLAQFDVPVLAETAVVLHDPDGLNPFVRADDVLWALSHAVRYLAGPPPAAGSDILAAVPVPVARQDTAVTYLYMPNGTSPADATRLAHRYAAHFTGDPGVSTFVTGLAPAEVSQQDHVLSRLDLFAIVSLVLVAVIVAVAFRSVLAPVLVLAIFAAGYAVSRPLLGQLATWLGFPMPQQIEPIVVALLLGVVTDYSVLLFSEMRRRLRDGTSAHDAVCQSLHHEAHVVLIAGLTVAGGTSALLAANFQLFRAFGPALTLTVLIGLALSLTLTPAVMTVVGPRLFRLSGASPRRDWRDVVRRSERTGPLIRVLTRRPTAALGAVLVAAALGAAAYPLIHARLSVSFVAALPSTDPVERGAAVLANAGIRGVTAPTELLVESRGIADHRQQLIRLQHQIEQQPGVAEVLGPAQNPLPQRFGVFFSRSGDAARFIVVFDADPLASQGIADYQRLRDRAHTLGRQAGLPTTARLEFTGQTAIAAELAQLTRSNLRLTLLAALGVEFVMLLIYLRALLTPIVLLACSSLGVAAALGLTTLVFQHALGHPGLTFYAPFATAVLLLSLGADYNVFAVGTIWDEARRRPLRRALRVAVPRSRRPIRTAGFILAATLGMVAIIPLGTFREMAFTMSVGLLIDTLLVRPVLTPAVLTLLGRAGGWPGHRIRTRPTNEPAAPPALVTEGSAT